MAAPLVSGCAALMREYYADERGHGLCATAEAFVYTAMIRLMVRRLARG